MSATKRASTNYGLAIGILMQDTTFPRPPGDIGNATTFNFPVVYRAVKGVEPAELIRHGDFRYLPQVIETAQELEGEGVRAIVGGCGFMAIYQQELVKAVSIPVYTSSLILVPLIHQSLRRDQKVGIITANSEWLTDRYIEAVGWSRESLPVVIAGLEGISSWQERLEGVSAFDEGELVRFMRDYIADYPEVGAIVLECTNLPPYARAIQEAVNLPVFDVVVMTNMIFDAVVRKKYEGFL